MPGSAGEYKPVGLGSGIGAANNSLFFAQATQASILKAAADANAAGGGYVIIPAGQITMTQALPAYNGVTYVGSGFQSTLTAATAPGGTVLVGNSSINGYEYNKTDLVTPPSAAGPFRAGMLVGAGLMNLSFSGYGYGIKIGALYNPGAMYSTFQNLCIVNCSQWGLWLENYAVCHVENVAIYNASVAVGGLMRADSSNGVLNSGNSYWFQNSTVMANYGQRGYCTWARGGSATINIDIGTGNSSSNGSNSFSQSQAATMSNTSPNIGVTDSTKFPVGMPVIFDATANGFTTNQIYFILTSASNVVTVGNTTYGTAIAATGNAAVNITSNGYALFEYASQDATSQVLAISEYGGDAEGAATVGIVFQRANRNYIVSGFIAGGNVINFCFRDNCANNRIDHGRPYSVDQDSSSAGGMNGYLGAASGVTNTWQNPQLDTDGTIIGSVGYLGYAAATGGTSIKAQVFLDSGLTGVLTQRDTFTNTAQTYNIANSWTTSSNYEMFQLGWAGNIFNIGSIKAGAGASRPFQFLYGNGVVGDFGNSIASYWKFSADINIGNGFATTGGASDFLMWNGAVLAFSSSGSVVSTYNGDTGMSRFGAGVFAFGNGNAADVSATLRAKAYVATGDPGAGVASTNTLSNGASTTISTGVGSVKMSSANPGTNTGWIKCYVGTQVAWIPTWTTNAP